MYLSREQFRKEALLRRSLCVFLFSAQWHAPCRALVPVIERLRKEKPDVFFGEIDIDSEIALAMDFNITEIPTLVFLKEGRLITKYTGLPSENDLCRMIAENE